MTIMITPRTTSIDSRRARFEVALALGALAAAHALCLDKSRSTIELHDRASDDLGPG
jgi:hypothetical protein